MKLLCRTLILFLFSGLSLAASGQANMKVTTFILPNGLTVYLNEDHTKPEIFGAVVVKAGSKYDPHDATGLAHYLEHMCFKGTQTMGTIDYAKEKPYLDSITALYDQLSTTTDEAKRTEIQNKINDVSLRAANYAIPNEMDRLLKSIGSKGVNAFTSNEEIVYHNSFPSHQVNKWLDIYSERFINPVFRLFQPELEVVYEEKNRGADDYGTALFETYLKNFFKHHPYGQQTTIGETEHLKNPPLRKMEAYYNTYFVANNMGLVLAGDFNTAEVIPMIQEKFGRWKTGEVPKYPVYTEDPFKGRELLEVKLTPIKMGVMGFRTVNDNDPDVFPLEICHYLLSNQGETGLLDQLRQDNKLQYAGIFPMNLNDMGGSMVFFMPKVVGQSLDEVESLVNSQLEKLRTGNYSDELFEAAKNNLRAEFYRKLEDNQSRAFYLTDCFIRGISWEEFMKYPDRIAALKKEDIQKIANKYFGSDYLVLQSTMGFPKKDKLTKPGFKPVPQKDGLVSEYAEKFNKMQSLSPTPRFVDFKKDVSESRLPSGSRLFVSPNPVNDIFSAKLKYKVNNTQIQLLNSAAGYVSTLGTGNLDPKAFKMKMNQWACTYSIYATNDEMVVDVSGLEENADSAIALIYKLVSDPKADDTKLKLLIEDEKSSRKLETGDPQSVAGILRSYMVYGTNSPELNRYSMKELEKIKPDQLISAFKSATAYPLSIHYVGKRGEPDVNSIFTRYNFAGGSAPDKTGSIAEKPRPVMNYKEPVVYVLYRKDARQTHIYFYGYGNQYDRNSVPKQKAFNDYFGGDMSSIVFQEVRELRSLAYSARCVYSEPSDKSRPNTLSGYVGCQGDKTKDAVTTMMDLLRNMPEKPERLDAIKKGLVDAAYSGRPDFRYISETVERWEDFGYAQDPNQLNVANYQNLTFDDIVSYYNSNIKNLPVSMAIVGTKDNIPMADLKKLGKVVVVKESDIRKN